MTRFTSCWVLAGGLVLLAGPAFGEDQGDAEAASLRASIEHERAAVEARFNARQVECAGRFAMTACVDRAKAERREALAPLDKSLSALDEAQRRRRAAERLKRIEEKAQAAAVDTPPKSPKVQREPPPRTTAIEALPPRAGPVSGAHSRPEPPKPGAAAAYERRQREAAEHREAVERRNDERAQRRAPAAPLPAPSAAGG